MTPDFWRGRRVFLTGHTGFKGAWLTLWLHALGAEVAGYALSPPTAPSLFDLAGVADLCRHVTGDVRDLDSLTRAMHACRPEIVIHMAAQALVGHSYRAPVETYATNVMGTVHVLEAARGCEGLKAIVNVTSDKCYDNREWLWGYRECDPLGGRDPYSSSKGCAELVAAAYGASFLDRPGGPAVASARAGNVIGGGDWAADRLVPDMVRAFLASRAVDIRHPDAIRPWQHVLEPLSGYLLLAERLASGDRSFAGGWNFGPAPDAVRSVGDMADTLAALWGEGCGWNDVSDPSAFHEARLLQLDSTKARMLLGWKPHWSLDEALKVTVEWYREVAAGASARALCLAQVVDYAKAIPRKV